MKFLTALSMVLPLAAAKISYDGYQAFHIKTDDIDAVNKALSDLSTVSLQCGAKSGGVDVAIAPESLEAFRKLNLDATVVHEDLGADLTKEGSFKPYKATVKVSSSEAAALPDPSYFESYHEIEAHDQFLSDLQAAFPSNSELFDVGESFEGRPISGIHLYGADGPGKPAVIWHATVHAREWVTAPTVEYLTYKLIEDYQAGGASVATLDAYDFFVLPIVNPDGFAYTYESDRLWRKSRQPRDGESCIGTDINRNWPAHWDVPGGSSPDACDETYRGEAPGDTPENTALNSHISSIGAAQGIKWYVDWHSFSQLLLLPYGYSCSAVADNIDRQLELAGGVAAAIEGVHGTSFVYGPTCETIYQTAGGSLDWVYDEAGAELSWSYELRPSGGGADGFVLPPEQILPSGEENWAGVQWLFANW